ncbi:unnamed protein product, partial [marine sediment metagenome]
KDASLGTGKGMVDQLFGAPRTPTAPHSGELKADKPFNFEDFLKSRERLAVQKERQRYQHKIEEEHLVFHRKQEEAKLQIKAVQNELKKLADASQGLSIEIKKATFTAAVEPGTYHENFFDRIRRLIELARKKIVESKSWLETFNHRSKKRSHYWGQVKKSGTKFMLSQERYMATQAG